MAKHKVEVIEAKHKAMGWYPWWSWRCSCGKESRDSWLDKTRAAYLGRLHVARAETGFSGSH